MQIALDQLHYLRDTQGLFTDLDAELVRVSVLLGRVVAETPVGEHALVVVVAEHYVGADVVDRVLIYLLEYRWVW